MIIMQSIAFSFALSLDAFASSLAYGTQGIKIPKRSMIWVNLICSVVVGLGIVAGRVFKNFMPAKWLSLLGFSILIFLSLVKIFEFSIKRWIRVSKNCAKKEFHFLNFCFLLEVILDTTQADTDCSKVLSIKESYALAIALSLDGFTAGISAGVLEFNTWLVMLFVFITGIAAILAGSFFGKRIAAKAELDLSWISGVILLLLALLKL